MIVILAMLFLNTISVVTLQDIEGSGVNPPRSNHGYHNVIESTANVPTPAEAHIDTMPSNTVTQGSYHVDKDSSVEAGIIEPQGSTTPPPVPDNLEPGISQPQNDARTPLPAHVPIINKVPKNMYRHKTTTRTRTSATQTTIHNEKCSYTVKLAACDVTKKTVSPEEGILSKDLLRTTSLLLSNLTHHILERELRDDHLRQNKASDIYNMEQQMEGFKRRLSDEMQVTAKENVELKKQIVQIQNDVSAVILEKKKISKDNSKMLQEQKLLNAELKAAKRAWREIQNVLEQFKNQSQLVQDLKVRLKEEREIQSNITKALIKVQESEESTCPHKFIKWNQSCYYFSTDMLTNWLNARHACRRLHADLVSVESRQEHKFLQKQLMGIAHAAWTSGMRQLRKTGPQWVWMTTGLPIAYTAWYPKQPNNEGDCLLLFQPYGFAFDDAMCTGDYYYVCEKQAHRVPFD